MFPTVTNRAVTLLTFVIAVVGSIDAVVGGNADLVAVFVLVGVLQLVLLLRMSSRRPAVPVRGDLVRWIRDRALAEGDSPALIVDRAISAYRADLLGVGAEGLPPSCGVTAAPRTERARDRAAG